jgi:hypothetical protein
LGGRLAGLFRQSGIQVIETGRMGGASESLPSSNDRDLEWTVLEADLQNWVPAQEIRRMKRLDQQAWKRKERILYVPTHFAWGRVPVQMV